MNNFRMLMCIFIMPILAFAQSSYDLGWEQGYEEGYCYNKYGCVAPPAPVSSVPTPGNDNYKGGYNAGFVKGMEDAKKRDAEGGSSASNSSSSSCCSAGGFYGQLTPLGNEFSETARYLKESDRMQGVYSNKGKSNSRPSKAVKTPMPIMTQR